LAHSLGLRMVAECVETEVAYAALKGMGCDQAQGFYISRPVPAAYLGTGSATGPLSTRPSIPQQRLTAVALRQGRSAGTTEVPPARQLSGNQDRR